MIRDTHLVGFVARHSRDSKLACRLLFILAVMAAPCATATDKESVTTQLESYLNTCHEVGVCNGTYLVTQGDKVLYTGALGHASYTGDEELSLDHMFDIGSISKQVTAATVMRLIEQGRLRLDDAVVNHSPKFPYPRVTLRHLLTHTSGLPDLMSLYPQSRSSTPASEPVLFHDAVDVLADRAAPLRFEPGSRFEYSNGGYIVLADVVERTAGVPFLDFLHGTFFGPLKMSRTWLRTPDNESSIMPRAFGFRPQSDGGRRRLDQITGLYVRGAGGIYSTVRDLQLWMRAMQQGEAISTASWKAATTPATLNDGSTVPHGFGLSLRPSKRGAPRVTHGGHWRGFKSDLTLWPTINVVAVQLTNNGEDDSVEQVRDAIERILAGEVPPRVLEPIDRPLRARLGQDTLPSVERWLNAELSARPFNFDFRNEPMNRLGYQLLEGKMPDKAILVFLANTRAHPTAANTYDSLADAYLAKGDRPRAIEALRRVLQLDPEASSAIEKLHLLEQRP